MTNKMLSDNAKRKDLIEAINKQSECIADLYEKNTKLKNRLKELEKAHYSSRTLKELAEK